jgi:hypothetical protein
MQFELEPFSWSRPSFDVLSTTPKPGLAERRACGLIGVHRRSWRYRLKKRNEVALRGSAARVGGRAPAIQLLAVVHFPSAAEGTNGMLRRLVNHKRVDRLYREKGSRCSVGGAAISSGSTGAAGASDGGERSVNDRLHA